MRRHLRVRVLEPLRLQLTQGVSPGRLAMALSLGVVIGVFPVLGTTTILCALVAVSLRLNQPAIQVGNFIASPLVVAFFVPLFNLGAWLFGQPPVGFTFAQLRAELRADLAGTMSHYALAVVRAVAAWALFAPIAVAVLFLAFRFLLRRVTLPKAPLA